MGGENGSRHVRFFELTTPNPQSTNHDDGDDEYDIERIERRRRWKLQAIPLVIFFFLFVSVLVPFVSNNKPIDGTHCTQLCTHVDN
ncbi:hypothetical protein DYB32_006043 [Aphanomyces invadans]|uniref:Transmembrane protein n=1 Tax=Aphanomyces invadans TaxID=157072 RepID=A0A3R6ZNN3_9STRA|nr:hypothetical protein DYB32_006043 [Aphanomyces invadans]